jgi:hypothetical protein
MSKRGGRGSDRGGRGTKDDKSRSSQVRAKKLKHDFSKQAFETELLRAKKLKKEMDGYVKELETELHRAAKKLKNDSLKQKLETELLTAKKLKKDFKSCEKSFAQLLKLQLAKEAKLINKGHKGHSKGKKLPNETPPNCPNESADRYAVVRNDVHSTPQPRLAPSPKKGKGKRNDVTATSGKEKHRNGVQFTQVHRRFEPSIAKLLKQPLGIATMPVSGIKQCSTPRHIKGAAKNDGFRRSEPTHMIPQEHTLMMRPQECIVHMIPQERTLTMMSTCPKMTRRFQECMLTKFQECILPIRSQECLMPRSQECLMPRSQEWMGMQSMPQTALRFRISTTPHKRLSQ